MHIKSLSLRSVIPTAISIILSTAIYSQVNAAGFALIENSASGQGNAYAGAAAIAEDASTIWFNPAGMTYLGNDQMVVAAHVIVPKSDFTNVNSTSAPLLGSTPLSGGNDDGGSNAFVGNFYYLKAIDDRMKFGFGVTTPFGLATKYDDNWVGRYHAIETDMKTLNFNPSIAYRVDDKVSIGAGLNFLVADVILTSAVDFGAVCIALSASCGAPGGGADGKADLTGDNFDDVAFGINVGLMIKLDESARLGISYRSKMRVNVEGDANFTVPAAASFVPGATGSFVDTTLTASVVLPPSLSASYMRDMDNLKLLADVTWTGWNSFEELRINYNSAQADTVTTESWKNTVRVSLGADYQQSDKLTLRAGWAYDETPIPDAEHRTPRIPGHSRRWLSLGFTYDLSQALTLDMGYSHLFVSKTHINNTFESAVPTLAATLNGTYDASVDILSAQLRWNY